MTRQTLIIDADDTLWENNIYFDRAIEEFLDFLDHATMSRADVRAVLNEIERANIASQGYGAAGFSRNLRQCYEHLAERDIGDDDLATVMAFGERILSQEIELIDGVVETLNYLGGRHHLILMTKGHPEEQRLKVDRSGLEGHFRHVAIVREKDPAAYEELTAELTLAPERTWMVGNSPRSDINAPLAAGLNAVFVPHESTWSLELQELATGPGRLLVLERFTQLREHF
ncbi:MAG: HAD hydrolase-like protein [Chloroflexota bacterium]|nr:HAD hydrolase-like protein [Chloroflexota bacterium]